METSRISAPSSRVFRGALHAKSEKPQGDWNSYLGGRVIIVLERVGLGKSTARTFDKTLTKMHEFERGAAVEQVDRITNDHQTLARALSADYVAVEFRLYRNGFCYLKEPSIGDHGVDGNGKHDLTGMARNIAAQAFYFVKEIGHRHCHHHVTTDTLCDLYRIHDQEDWRALTLYPIYRRVIHLKRQTPEIAIERAGGLLAYAETFAKLWGQDTSIDPNSPTHPERIPQYFSNQTHRSLNASNQVFENKVADKRYRQSLLLNVMVFVLIVTSGLFSLSGLVNSPSNDNTNPAPILYYIREFVLTQPFYLIVSIVLLMALVYVFLRVQRPLRHGEKGVPVLFNIRNAVRLFQFRSRWIIGGIIAAIAVVMLSASAWLAFLV